MSQSTSNNVGQRNSRVQKAPGPTSKKRKRTDEHCHQSVSMDHKNRDKASEETSWDHSFNELAEFKAINGHVSLPSGKLDDWMRLQRRLFGEGKLSQQCTDKLLSLGVMLQPPDSKKMHQYLGNPPIIGPPSLPPFSPTERYWSESLSQTSITPTAQSHESQTIDDKIWDHTFLELEIFKMECGHVDLPSGKLKKWVAQQRQLFKERNLSHRCIQKLLSVGVDVTLARPYKKKSTSSMTGANAISSSGMDDDTRPKGVKKKGQQKKAPNIHDAKTSATSDGRSIRDQKEIAKTAPVGICTAAHLVINNGFTPREALHVTMFPCTEQKLCEHLNGKSKQGRNRKELEMPGSNILPKSLSMAEGGISPSGKQPTNSSRKSKHSDDSTTAATKKKKASDSTTAATKKKKASDSTTATTKNKKSKPEKLRQTKSPQDNEKNGCKVIEKSNIETPEQKWQNMFYQLVIFQAKNNGSTLVPSDGGPLARWVVEQRKIYNKQSKGEEISEEQAGHIVALNQIGFCWEIRTDKSRCMGSKWDKMFEELKSYKNEHGHCNVQQKENKALSNWVNLNRTSYRYAKKALKCFQEKYPNLPIPKPEDLSRSAKWDTGLKATDIIVTEDRINKLNSLDFEWDRAPSWTPFKKRLEEFAAFRLEHGHGWVPQFYEKNKSLGKWVKKIRYECKRYTEGKPSQLNEDRIRQLTEAGFEFSSGIKGKNSEEPLGQPPIPAGIWTETYD